MRNHVEVIKDVNVVSKNDTDAKLHFQKVIYHLEDGDQRGYRFMWSYEDRLKPHMGQARIPSIRVLFKLLTMAFIDGWIKLPPALSLSIGGTK